MRNRAKLVLVVGASGAGKDTLIRLAQARVGHSLPIAFVSREITRPTDARREHVAVTCGQFEQRAEAGYYLLSWAAHGVWYGIPAQARSALRDGLVVVSIASRGAIDEARALPWECHVVEVHAPPSVLRQRLLRRARQDGSGVEGRLARASQFQVRGQNVHRIDNGGELATSGAAFCGLLRELADPALLRQTAS